MYFEREKRWESGESPEVVIALLVTQTRPGGADARRWSISLPSSAASNLVEYRNLDYIIG